MAAMVSASGEVGYGAQLQGMPIGKALSPAFEEQASRSSAEVGTPRCASGFQKKRS